MTTWSCCRGIQLHTTSDVMYPLCPMCEELRDIARVRGRHVDGGLPCHVTWWMIHGGGEGQRGQGPWWHGTVRRGWWEERLLVRLLSWCYGYSTMAGTMGICHRAHSSLCIRLLRAPQLHYSPVHRSQRLLIPGNFSRPMSAAARQ